MTYYATGIIILEHIPYFQKMMNKQRLIGFVVYVETDMGANTKQSIELRSRLESDTNYYQSYFFNTEWFPDFYEQFLLYITKIEEFRNMINTIVPSFIVDELTPMLFGSK